MVRAADSGVSKLKELVLIDALEIGDMTYLQGGVGDLAADKVGDALCDTFF